MKKLLWLLFIPLPVFGQSLPDSLQQKIDSLFRRYTSSTPGCAVAVIKNGELVFKKGYGMSNLEYNIPITPASIFHIASVSKQYVAFCMLLLQQQGKLSLDDDIHKWLDYVPDFGKKITIRHLIYHTSGLRDQWQLLANAGWQLDDVITQEHIIKLVSKQKALNFNPGEEYMYCNTGYTLMAEIVKKASGLTLREYTHQYIFTPLGMNDTHFHDDYREIIKNRTYSYVPKGSNTYQHAVLSYSTVGATSLFTTVEDEAKWLLNFEQPIVGGKELVEKMVETGELNNGKKLNYAFGLAVDQYKGWKRIGHDGGDAGYRTYAGRFPEQHLGIIVFSNLGFVNPNSLSMQIADMLLPAKEVIVQKKSTSADSNIIKRLAGNYYSERGDLIRLVLENGKLFNRSAGQSFGGTEWVLSPEDADRYLLSNGNILRLEGRNTKDSIREFTIEDPNGFITFLRQPILVSRPEDARNFTGRYYNDETEAFYTIAEKEGKLILQHRKHPDGNLTNTAPDQFSCNNWWMNNIRFLRDQKGQVDALEVNGGRILHLRYNKVK